MTVFGSQAQRRPARVASAHARGRDQHLADLVAAREFQEITQFVAACRQQWPGAMIVLRPDGAPTGANAPIKPEIRLTKRNEEPDGASHWRPSPSLTQGVSWQPIVTMHSKNCRSARRHRG
jgi:hypothetical protein